MGSGGLGFRVLVMLGFGGFGSEDLGLQVQGGGSHATRFWVP